MTTVTPKKFVKMHGYYLTDGDFNRSKHTRNQAIQFAKRDHKRLGLSGMMEIHVVETDTDYIVSSCTKPLNLI